MRHTLALLLVCLCGFVANAQDNGKKKQPPPPTSFDPNPSYYKKADEPRAAVRLSPKSKKKNSRKKGFEWQLEQKKKEFDKRMVANAKKYKKEARISQKPQYSDPSYFGHKRKPKKRPPGKRKLCKECLIVH